MRETTVNGDKRHLVFVLIGVLVFAALTALGYNAFASGDFEDGVEKVFLRTPGLPEGSALRTWSATEPAPTPALPADRLRFVMPTGADRHDLHAAVERYAPQLWVGAYQREWTPLGMLEK